MRWLKARPEKAESADGYASPPKCKKELHLFLGMITYFSNFSPSNADICELLRKFMSVKSEWVWNGTYQDPYDKTTKLITKDLCMKLMPQSPCTWRWMHLA